MVIEAAREFAEQKVNAFLASAKKELKDFGVEALATLYIASKSPTSFYRRLEGRYGAGRAAAIPVLGLVVPGVFTVMGLATEDIPVAGGALGALVGEITFGLPVVIGVELSAEDPSQSSPMVDK